jgi:hypothetical protein
VVNSIQRSAERDALGEAAQLVAAPLRSSERGLGSLGYPLHLILCHHGHDADREPAGVRHVGRDKVDAAP